MIDCVYMMYEYIFHIQMQINLLQHNVCAMTLTHYIIIWQSQLKHTEYIV